MKEIFVNKNDHYEILIFIAGVFSTFQALTFRGITVFTWFLLGLLFLGLVEKRGKVSFNFKSVKEILILLVIFTMTVTEFITVFLDEYPAWTGRSVKNFVLMTAVFILFFILRNGRFQDYGINLSRLNNLRENTENVYGRTYFKGVMVSCIIQYIVCYISYILIFLPVTVNNM